MQRVDLVELRAAARHAQILDSTCVLVAMSNLRRSADLGGSSLLDYAIQGSEESVPTSR